MASLQVAMTPVQTVTDEHEQLHMKDAAKLDMLYLSHLIYIIRDHPTAALFLLWYDRRRACQQEAGS